MTVMLIGGKKMCGYEARHRTAAQMSDGATVEITQIRYWVAILAQM